MALINIFHQFNVCGINSDAIYNAKVNSNISRREFLKQLVIALTKTY